MHAKIFLAVLLCVESLHGQNFWEPVLPSAGFVVAIIANSQGHLFAASYASGVYRSTDGGATWVQANSGLMFSSALGLAVNPQNGDLFVSSGSRIYRSTNNGESWVLRNSTTFTDGAWRLVVNNQGMLFAAPNSSDSLRRSSDNGLTWSIAHNGLPHGVVADIRLHANNDLYAAKKGDWVFRTSNNGENWFALPSPPPIFLDADAIAFGSGGEIYVGDDGQGFFKSTDGGSSWEQMNSGLPNQYVWALAVSGQGHLFAGLASNGICRSTNAGAYWDSINTGLGASRRIYSLFVAASGHLFAGTISGIFRSVQPVTQVADNPSSFPAQYFLSQNYPNPFNPSTTIAYELTVESIVTLKIYDVLGREVAILVNKTESAGKHSVLWNTTSEMSSGFYLYHLQARSKKGDGSFRSTKKMILLR